MIGELPWSCMHGEEDGLRARAETNRDMREATRAWQVSFPLERHQPDEQGRRRVHPGNRVQANGGVVDVWYLDDSTVGMDPRLCLLYLRAYDRHNRDGRRNRIKTKMILSATLMEV